MTTKQHGQQKASVQVPPKSIPPSKVPQPQQIVLRMTPAEAKAVSRALRHVAEQHQQYAQPVALPVDVATSDLLTGVADRLHAQPAACGATHPEVDGGRPCVLNPSHGGRHVTAAGFWWEEPHG